MVKKVEKSSNNKTFSLNFTHADIVGMMNDPQVMIDGGSVAEDQIFEICLRKNNGSEIVLRELISTDTLILRFKKVITTNVEDNFDFIDIG